MSEQTLEQLYLEWERAKRERGPRHPVTWEIRRQYLLAQAKWRESVRPAMMREEQCQSEFSASV